MAVSDEHKTLVHYTTYRGALAILDSQSLWATHHHFLNDFREGTLFKEVFINILEIYVQEVLENRAKASLPIKRFIEQKGGIRKVTRNEANAVVDAYYNDFVKNVFITSFCGESTDPLTEEAGLLSQWRGYGQDGGCALVFDTKRLEEMLEAEAIRYFYMSGTLLSVIYSHETDKDADFREDLRILATDAVAILEAIIDDHKDDVNLNSFGEFVRSMSRYKHWGFREEQEVRIVMVPGSFMYFTEDEILEKGIRETLEKRIMYRERGGRRIPYIDLFEDLEKQLPIKRIIIGPHQEKSRRVEILRERLRASDIEVRASEIPFIA